ncbi:MAG: Arc family DNA-binding protein [Syntrophomonadaceae bacterium]|nr:Arc family DNA-binding protein [Syntrophomonadaceae bacterium]
MIDIERCSKMTLKSDKTRILVSLPIELKKQVEELAYSKNRSVSNYIVTLIQQEIKKESKKETV